MTAAPVHARQYFNDPAAQATLQLPPHSRPEPPATGAPALTAAAGRTAGDEGEGTPTRSSGAEEEAAVPRRSMASSAAAPWEREATLLAVSEHLPPAMVACTWRLSGYTLVKQLYTGYASLVFVAECKCSSAKVVLKVYNTEGLEALHRCQVDREIRIHSRLHHPHIVQFYAAFQEGSHLVLVQEYADGGDLFAAVSRSPAGTCRLTERCLVNAVLQPLLLALDYLHSQGILHRDIKLENLVLCNRQLKVLDFGLSIDTNEEHPVTRAGTLAYLAPEVLSCPYKALPEENKDKQHLHYGKAADVYSVGVLAHELLVGHAPFLGATNEDAVRIKLESDPRDLRFPTLTSRHGRDFIMQALSKRPEERGTTAELLSHAWVNTFTEPQPAERRRKQQEVALPRACSASQEEGARAPQSPLAPSTPPSRPASCQLLREPCVSVDEARWGGVQRQARPQPVQTAPAGAGEAPAGAGAAAVRAPVTPAREDAAQARRQEALGKLVAIIEAAEQRGRAACAASAPRRPAKVSLGSL